MTAVSASGLIKSYDGATVLSLDTLALDSARVHVIVGPNGSGKTTFLRLVAGIERPDAGELRVLESGWEQPRAAVRALRA